MTFKYDGAPPKAPAITPQKDPEFCGKFDLVDESLLVSSNGGIQNVIAYLYLGRGKKAPAAHPDLASKAKEKIVFDNNECRFAPRVLFVHTNQPLEVKNTDSVGHNTNVAFFSNQAFNQLIPAGGSFNVTMKSAERLPSKVSCNIHPWMTGWLVVKDNPYMAASDENGELVIENLPVGKWTFQLWQEKAGYVAKAKQNGKSVSWRRGRMEVEIKPGENDLGEIKLAPSLFK